MTDLVETQSVEDRMIALLGDDSPKAEPKESDAQEEVIEEPQNDEEEAETEEQDSEEPPEPTVKLKLKRGEEEIEVDQAEAVELAQKGYDYTKKTQELANERQQVQMYAQALKAQEQNLAQLEQTQAAFIKDISRIEGIDEQLAQYNQLDWNALSDNDPVQAQKLWIAKEQLQNKRTQAIYEIQQKQAQIAQNKQQLAYQAQVEQAQQLERARAELLKSFPDWSETKAKDLRESAKHYGFSDAELSAVTDPRTVKLLADAVAYRKLQASKTNVTNKVQGKPPVVKPGSKPANSIAKSNYANARQELRKTGNSELAAKLIERML